MGIPEAGPTQASPSSILLAVGGAHSNMHLPWAWCLVPNTDHARRFWR